jgi:hypothetical protein
VLRAAVVNHFASPASQKIIYFVTSWASRL